MIVKSIIISVLCSVSYRFKSCSGHGCLCLFFNSTVHSLCPCHPFNWKGLCCNADKNIQDGM